MAQVMLPGSIRLLPESVLTNHQWGLVVFIYLRQFHRKCSIYDWFKNTDKTPRGQWVKYLNMTPYLFIQTGLEVYIISSFTLSSNSKTRYPTSRHLNESHIFSNKWIINSLQPSDEYMHQWVSSSSLQVMACHLIGDKPLPEPMLAYLWLIHWEQISTQFDSKHNNFSKIKWNWKCNLQKGDHLVEALMCLSISSGSFNSIHYEFYRNIN